MGLRDDGGWFPGMEQPNLRHRQRLIENQLSAAKKGQLFVIVATNDGIPNLRAATAMGESAVSS